MSKIWPIVALCIALAACNRQPPAEPVAATAMDTVTSGDNGGAVSSPTVASKPLTADVLKGTKWPLARLASGQATISCDTDYATAGDGAPLANLEFFSVLDAMDGCRESGVVRLRYHGKISADFTDLVQRVAAMAERMDIDKRILDLDSTGGQVEDGIRAGDSIGATHWTIWVREGSVCHSACVFILAAGDNRLVSGQVGIHRIIRLHSDATTRAELEQELRAVHDQIKDYLARNGVDIAVADMMMSVPSRDLRLLTADELRQYGLSGSNPVQDDLERIGLARKCGEDFVHRKEAFAHAFERKCAASGDEVEKMSDCGMQLRQRYGFPDRKCPGQSPLSEYD
jgi:ATP-dependent protease ClpP protease subunit